ncbi:MAG: hypothetical protein OQK82_06100 [Candidatus Pacearchaeota archaeon]|nr:hypothetical protein [Candidatus Pacearchaeota archaeon]
MNLSAALGKVVAVNEQGKHLKFTLSIWQKKTCYIPCVIFNVSEEDKDYVCSLQTSTLIVWVQGWLVNYEIRLHGTRFTTIELATKRFNIKEFDSSTNLDKFCSPYRIPSLLNLTLSISKLIFKEPKETSSNPSPIIF